MLNLFEGVLLVKFSRKSREQVKCRTEQSGVYSLPVFETLRDSIVRPSLPDPWFPTRLCVTTVSDEESGEFGHSK